MRCCDWNGHSPLLEGERRKQNNLLWRENRRSWEIWNPRCWSGSGQTRYKIPFFEYIFFPFNVSKYVLRTNIWGGGYDYKQSFSGRVSQLVMMSRALEADEVAKVAHLSEASWGGCKKSETYFTFVKPTHTIKVLLLFICEGQTEVFSSFICINCKLS